MGHGTRRWLAGLGTAAALGASVLGSAGVASAGVAGPAGLSARSGPAVRLTAAAAPGSVYVPTGKILTLGDHGPAVRALQQRLNFLHYYPGKIDGRLGWATMEAVWAFKEVQAGTWRPRNPSIVGPAMQRQLVRPRLPKVLFRHGGRTRIEVNKKTEVLVVYHNTNKIALISHVSTADETRPDGNGWVTPNGRYHAWEYLAGCVPDATFGGCLYNPIFFIGTAFAIHGMPNPTSTFSFDGVPLNPASHGCVRIPIDVSLILHKLIRVRARGGSPIYTAGPQVTAWP
jgi:Putative peptidoglycan binding domain/L,D-transpeptidase catalytic domain